MDINYKQVLIWKEMVAYFKLKYASFDYNDRNKATTIAIKVAGNAKKSQT
jgi:hypothetical protein